MKKLLLNRWFLGTLGVVLLALVLWFLGPYFAFGEARPLLSTLGRVVAVLVLALAWIAILQWQYFKAVRGSRKLAAEVAGQSVAPAVAAARPAGESKPAEAKAAQPADATQLKQRFEDATAQLRRDRRTGGGLYQLPWYVIIGPPGSGKTTALVNSGLRFPMEQELGKRAIRGVGGTRNCDWWFTDEAILLDTAGRYTTQDSDRIADGAGWGSFLQLLKKHRRRQPINGILIAYSASDLLTRTEQQFDGDVLAIRQRADELSRHLGIELPIYLLVTKVDLVAGFREYFENLDADGRAQVWGVTFPLEASREGQATGLLPAEFDGLVERLNRGVPQRLLEERDQRRRARLFAFPQQFAALRERLLALVGEAFSGTGFDRRLFLRGVYFTSGTQEGTPIDRLLGSLSRSLGVAPDAARPSAVEKGRAYFIEKLLRDVVLQESGLAGSSRRAELRHAVLQAAAYLGLAVIVAAGLVALTVSYRRNADYLEHVGESVAALGQAPAAAGAGEGWLVRLEQLRQVVNEAEHGGQDAPWSMRAGLYQGRAVAEAAREAYAREANVLLVPRLAQSFADRLEELAADPDRLYEYLKAYLMLGDPKRLEPGQLTFLAGIEWQRAYPDQPAVRDALARHLEALLAGQRLSPVSLDEGLVERARNALRAATPAALAYSRLKVLFAGEKYPPLRLDRKVQQLGELLLRRSGASGEQPIPALFTRDVFRESSGQGTGQMAKALQEDAWVFGDEAGATLVTDALVYDVLALYEQEYIDTWDRLLADLQLRPVPRDPKEAATFYGKLGSASSPLKVLLGLVADNTNLAPPEGAAAAAAGAGGVAGAADAAVAAAEKQALGKVQQNALGKILLQGQAAGGAAAVSREPGAAVTEHFAAIHELVGGPGGGAPIDRALEALKRMGGGVGALADAPGGTGGLAEIQRGGGGGAARELEVEVSQLPPVVADLLAPAVSAGQAIVRGQARSELAELYQGQVVRQCREIVSGRYPFKRDAALDVPVADFALLLGYGGVFDRFFQQHLAELVDTNRSPWRWREAAGGSIGLPASIPAQFELVEKIRQQFFRPGASEPDLRITLTPETLDATVRKLTLEINGQRLEYAHGPPPRWAVKWPTEASDQVAVTFDTGTGTSPNRVYDGPWALFRFVDASSPSRQTDVRFRLNVTADGAAARLLLDAGSVRNPFASPVLQRFRCG